LRIGNLVIQGRLVPLSKPLLVLTSKKLNTPSASDSDDSTQHCSSGILSSPVSSGAKRRREADDIAPSTPADKKARSSDAAASSAGSPAAAAASSSSSSSLNGSISSSSRARSSYLQTVAVIRHKYQFVHRPYAICDMGAAPGISNPSKSAFTPVTKKAATAAAVTSKVS
jgi:hypothetical protein